MGVPRGGSAFANESGNRLHFSGYIDGNGTQFSISELSFSATDTGNLLLNFGCSYGDTQFCEGQYNYGIGYVGEIDNADGTKTFVTTGPNTQLVNKLWMRGSGNSNAAYCSSCDLAGQQAALDEAVLQMGGAETFVGTYMLDLGDSGTVTGSGNFDFTPEPSNLLLAAAGAMLLFAGMRRRAHR